MSYLKGVVPHVASLVPYQVLVERCSRKMMAMMEVRLDHNQFVSINRNSAVELTITMESFGHEHKEAIVKALKDNGYNPQIVQPKNTYN